MGRQIKTRDPLMVKLINGATKGGVHVDRKKEEDRTAARQKVSAGDLCPYCNEPLEDDDDDICEDCQELLDEYNRDNRD